MAVYLTVIFINLLFIFKINLFLFFLIYSIVLILPYINMNHPPQKKL